MYFVAIHDVIYTLDNDFQFLIQFWTTFQTRNDLSSLHSKCNLGMCVAIHLVPYMPPTNKVPWHIPSFILYHLNGIQLSNSLGKGKYSSVHSSHLCRTCDWKILFMTYTFVMNHIYILIMHMAIGRLNMNTLVMQLKIDSEFAVQLPDKAYCQQRLKT